MHKINELTETIIGHGIEVHRCLSPGLSEGAYERALCLELTWARIPCQRQIGIPVIYKGEVVTEHRPDLVVADLVVVEVKSVECVTRVHRAQMLVSQSDGQRARVDRELQRGCPENRYSPRRAAGRGEDPVAWHRATADE